MIPLYSPIDFASYFLERDLRVRKERDILQSVVLTYPFIISSEYTDNPPLFSNHVYRELLNLSSKTDDLYEANTLLESTNDIFSPNSALSKLAHDKIVSYFKYLWLDVVFLSSDFRRRLKIRTVLSDLGYKRRSKEISKSLNTALELVPLFCSRHNQEVDITEEPLDTMVSFTVDWGRLLHIRDSM